MRLHTDLECDVEVTTVMRIRGKSLEGWLKKKDVTTSW